ncbi:MAG: glycosyltransferase family 4 protein [Acidobacteria bacterium]|nr:glycosyltransferase family 4 protein [Acidobacteriota bacterium]
MKVLYLLDSLNRGGIEVLCVDICRNAQANGLDLMVAATGGGDLEADFRESRVEFIRLTRRLPIDLAVVAKLRKIIHERKIQIVHTYQAVEGIHAYLACFGTNVKTVLSHQGFVADKKNRLTLRFLLPRVAMNVVISQGLRRWYESQIKLKFSDNVKIIYNGVDKKRLVWHGETLKGELGLPADVLLFGMIANFYRDPRKDQLTVCRALPKIFAEIPNAYCVFVGKTEAGAEHKFTECARFCRKNKIDNRVFFLGGRADVPKILKSLDIFVFSSIHEGLGIAALEAMLTNVPCVLSDIEPFLEISENGKYAKIFPVQNAEILSEKILELFKNRGMRENLASRAFDFATENFSIEAHLRELKKLYDSIL